MADDRKVLYPCDPSKNTECNKRGCYLNGGPCRSTTHAEYCDAGDLISKQALLYALDDIELIEDGDVDSNELEDLIKRLPTIEAEPVKHGHWVTTASHLAADVIIYCSECETEYSLRDLLSVGEVDVFGHVIVPNCCPHCGTIMDEVEK